jgi:hypothetical protein
MNQRWIQRVLLAVLVCVPVLAAEPTWPDIPASTWNIQASDYPGTPGAVVLLDRYLFHPKELERFRRLLILGASGRADAQLAILGDPIDKLEGRTTTPGGQVIPFSPTGDIVKFMKLKVGREELNVRKVYPPGLTDRCVVDIRWVEPNLSKTRPLPEWYGYGFSFSLSGSLPVKRVEAAFDAQVLIEEWARKFQVTATTKHRQELKEGVEWHIFEDIPARQEEILASKAEQRLPAIRWFWVPDIGHWLVRLNLLSKTMTFTDGAACSLFFWRFNEEWEPDRAALTQLRQLGASPSGLGVRERVVTAVQRLRSAVRTVREVSDSPKGWDREDVKLERVLRRGWGTSRQVTLLGYYMLRELSLNPSLVNAIDREENRLHDLRDLFQYDALLLSVADESGSSMFLEPGNT